MHSSAPSAVAVAMEVVNGATSALADIATGSSARFPHMTMPVVRGTTPFLEASAAPTHDTSMQAISRIADTVSSHAAEAAREVRSGDRRRASHSSAAAAVAAAQTAERMAEAAVIASAQEVATEGTDTVQPESELDAAASEAALRALLADAPHESDEVVTEHAAQAADRAEAATRCARTSDLITAVKHARKSASAAAKATRVCAIRNIEGEMRKVRCASVALVRASAAADTAALTGNLERRYTASFDATPFLVVPDDAFDAHIDLETRQLVEEHVPATAHEYVNDETPPAVQSSGEPGSEDRQVGTDVGVASVFGPTSGLPARGVEVVNPNMSLPHATGSDGDDGRAGDIAWSSLGSLFPVSADVGQTEDAVEGSSPSPVLDRSERSDESSDAESDDDEHGSAVAPSGGNTTHDQEADEPSRRRGRDVADHHVAHARGGKRRRMY